MRGTRSGFSTPSKTGGVTTKCNLIKGLRCTYGMEGLEGLRVGNADALEIRIAYYGNVICSAPGYNMVVSLSA